MSVAASSHWRYVRVMRIALLLLLLAVACESDEAKAGRLRNDMTLSCISARQSGEAQRQNECDVATRKYNRFMAGR